MPTKEIKHAEREHALLSASGAHRWLVCTPSARLEEQFADTTSDYAREGTLAHEIAELKLCKYFTDPMSQSTYTRRLNKFKKHELFQDEMLKHTDTYLDYLREITIGLDVQPYVAVERQIDYSVVVPEGFGTVDCLIIGGDTLYITDFKYGKGVPVSAENNPQMMLYALGAYYTYSFLYQIKNVHLAIIQPRIDNISEWEISADDLLAWGEEIKPIAQKAYAGEGEFVPGEHCKFCRAKAQCRAHAKMYTALEDFEMKKPPLLTNEEVGEVLERAQGLEAWVKALKEYALSACLNGEEIPGWKAVEGRSTRIYKDIDQAFEYLKSNGIDEALLYERVPLTVAKLEKQLGKKEFKSLLEEAGLVEKAPGKPTIAPESDKRPAIMNAPDAASDFT
ncbi:DUF2800 domain-containing protein [Heyndrickxia coagulans]|uniref:DUF2800 domain-containing protein n=1 Tax=Heyndrickxia coagulans TaxID=1398 RepID=UPI001451986F|nr:DUF2800 domain-containing protein [Heyndrickxia coagulans]MED4495575.1 DUF2800 domain-containing protein [Heyndrickxia coagulans]MED4534984.1 DUF2800 domain-containing protein [Heyndrickxia coagulans]QJE31824.1 DUF2800 domain-containing protein [Heyndrickxia coagulans]